MFNKIRKYFKKRELPKKIVKELKPSIIFLNSCGEEIKYEEHLTQEEMLIIKTDKGWEKIPVSGLRIKK
jgi:hypothetical protein